MKPYPSLRSCLPLLCLPLLVIACVSGEGEETGAETDTCLSSGCSGDELSDTGGDGDGDGDGETTATTGDGDGDGDGETTATTGDGDGDGDGGEAAIDAAGWSFGECAGPCLGGLTIGDDDLLSLTIEDWESQTVLQNGGVLSAEGRGQLDTVAAQLLGVELDEVYGCPDCDDGGASSLSLLRNGESSEHAYEFAAPPPVLAPADALVTELIAALRTCSESELLTLDEGCMPLEP